MVHLLHRLYGVHAPVYGVSHARPMQHPHNFWDLPQARNNTQLMHGDQKMDVRKVLQR